jgi:flavin reductase (DIM6/NTAB) family NADH-FMN oxidoreductase RutF
MSVKNPVKHLLMTVTQGVYVVGVGQGSLHNAFTASSVMLVSMRPPMLAIAVNPDNASYPLLVENGVFAVTVLHRDQFALADFFGNHSAKDEDKLSAVAWHPAPSGAPILDEGLSYLDCRVASRHPAGDHVVILAGISDGDFLQEGLRPLRYDEVGDMDGSDELLPEHLGIDSERVGLPGRTSRTRSMPGGKR